MLWKWNSMSCVTDKKWATTSFQSFKMYSCQWVPNDVLFVLISGTSFNTHGSHGGSQSTQGVRQCSHLPYQLYLSQQWQWDLSVCRRPPHQPVAPRDHGPQLQYPQIHVGVCVVPLPNPWNSLLNMLLCNARQINISVRFAGVYKTFVNSRISNTDVFSSSDMKTAGLTLKTFDRVTGKGQEAEFIGETILNG